MHIHELLMWAVQEGASDLHIAAGEIPALRVHGEVQRFQAPPLNGDDAKRLLFAIMSERQKAAFEEDMDTDFSVGIEGLARFRVNVFYQARGIAAVFRTIPETILRLDQLGMPPALRQIASFKNGLVLVTGPTGSGKSTTLAAMLDHINRTRREHILTIEDPIEFIHTPDRCIINQRELGSHTRTFSNALRAALREDPDVILIGELRDLETIQLALTAAETGHLVFGTLHTRGAAETIDRVIDAFPSSAQAQVRAQLSTSLQAVVSQLLLPRKNKMGRVCASEILVVSYAVRNLIRENKTFQISSMMQSAAASGNKTMATHLAELLRAGDISREIALEAAGDSELPSAPTTTSAKASKPGKGKTTSGNRK